MTTALTIGATGAKVLWQFDKVLSPSNASQQGQLSYNTTFADGSGLGGANKLYVVSGTLAASATLNLDLSGSVTDIYGTTVAFTKIKVLYFELTTDTASTGVTVGGHATAACYSFFHSATDADTDQPSIVVGNGGCLYICNPTSAGYAVTATTADILKITNLDGTNVATYRLVLVGA